MVNFPISTGVDFKFLQPDNQQINMIETTSNHLIWVMVQSILSKLYDRRILDEITMNVININCKSIGPVRLNHYLIKNDVDRFIMRLIIIVIKGINLDFDNNVTYLSGSRSIKEQYNTLTKWIDVIQTQSSQMKCDFDNIIVLINLFNVLNVYELIII